MKNVRYFVAKFLRISLFNFLFLFSLIASHTLSTASALAAQIQLAWDPSTGSNVAGYKVFYGRASQTYDKVIDAQNATCCTIDGLDDGAIYFFAAKAYDTSGNHSEYSEELVYNTPSAPVDSDGDGISDTDEINIYGTDPNNPDTDADGVSDGDELALWGNNWNGDDD